jgi:hypothetical protein
LGIPESFMREKRLIDSLEIELKLMKPKRVKRLFKKCYKNCLDVLTIQFFLNTIITYILYFPLEYNYRARLKKFI